MVNNPLLRLAISCGVWGGAPLASHECGDAETLRIWQWRLVGSNLERTGAVQNDLRRWTVFCWSMTWMMWCVLKEHAQEMGLIPMMDGLNVWWLYWVNVPLFHTWSIRGWCDAVLSCVCCFFCGGEMSKVKKVAWNQQKKFKFGKRLEKNTQQYPDAPWDKEYLNLH